MNSPGNVSERLDQRSTPGRVAALVLAVMATPEFSPRPGRAFIGL
jgi:hypothetical protein